MIQVARLDNMSAFGSRKRARCTRCHKVKGVTAGFVPFKVPGSPVVEKTVVPSPLSYRDFSLAQVGQSFMGIFGEPEARPILDAYALRGAGSADLRSRARRARPRWKKRKRLKSSRRHATRKLRNGKIAHCNVPSSYPRYDWKEARCSDCLAANTRLRGCL